MAKLLEPENVDMTSVNTSKSHSSTMKDNLLYNEILAHQDPAQVEGLSRFFKTGKGQYGEGDHFLGIKVPVTREVVKQCWQDTSFDDLETCIASEYHEMRLAALLTLVQIFKHAKKNKASIPCHCGQRPANRRFDDACESIPSTFVLLRSQNHRLRQSFQAGVQHPGP